MKINMKVLYILIVLVIAALALGCVGNKQTDISTKAPASSETSISPAATPAPTIGEDLFETEEDIAAIDAMLGDSTLDTSLSTAI